MPKTNFFGDLTFEHDQRFTKNFYVSHPAIVRVNSNPGEGVNLRHVFRLRKIINEVKGDGVSESAQTLSYGVVNGTTIKYNGIKDVSQKLKLGNTVLNYEIGYKPSEHNTDDRTVQLKHATKYEPSSGRIDSTETLKVGIPQVGPLRPWLTVDFLWNNIDQKRLLKNSLSFNVNEYHLGYKLEHDLDQVKTLVGLLTLKNRQGDFFLKADALKQHFTLGCNHQHTSSARHSIEAAYDHTQKTKGLFDQPVWLNFAGEYNLSPDITLKTKVQAKNELTLGMSWIHRFDRNLRFVFSDDFNLTRLVNEPAKTNYNFGLLLEWTI